MATNAKATANESERRAASAEESPLKSSVTYRVTTLLDFISQHKGGIGSREAARETGIDRSAVSRLLIQLEKLGWVEQTGERGDYAVGPKLFAVAAAVRERDSLWKAAEPIFARLVQRHNETIYLTVLRDDGVVFREKLDCSHAIRYVIELGTRFPLTTGAAGRAILSALPEDKVEEILAAGLKTYTPSSITDPDAYRVQLETDRRLGYAYSKSGWVKKGAGIAAPYFDAAGEVAGAITVSGPADRLTPRVAPQIGASVLAGARELSGRLGFYGTWGPAD